MADKPHALRFVIPGPPVGLQHEGARKGGGRRTEDKSRAYMKLCGTYALKAIADHRAQGQWPYGGDVSMEVEIYYGRKHPRPDPINVLDALQDGFTGVLWKDDRNVLGRPMLHWWPGKNIIKPPAMVYIPGPRGGRYIGGVCVRIEKIEG
jgi:hypothetical protein